MIVVTTVESDGFYTDRVCDDRSLVPGVLNINAVTAVEFIGDEDMDQLVLKFENLPWPKERDRVKYFGDTAKFILANWFA